MSRPNLILAIETSNPTSGPRGRDDEGRVVGPGVAIGPIEEFGGIIVDEPLAETSRHDDDLMPAIARVFDRAGAKPSDLTRVVVSIGPGGYTGVRIAVAAAKLIAEATGADTHGVFTPIAAVWKVNAERVTAVCLASKNDMTHVTLLPSRDWWEVNCAHVEQIAPRDDFLRASKRIREGREWIPAMCALGVIGVEQLSLLAPERLVADKFLPEPIRMWAQKAGIEIVEPVFSPATLLQLGCFCDSYDPAELTPIYPREPDAVRQWRLRKSGN